MKHTGTQEFILFETSLIPLKKTPDLRGRALTLLRRHAPVAGRLVALRVGSEKPTTPVQMLRKHYWEVGEAVLRYLA